MQLDASLRELWEQQDGRWQLQLPTGWMQGRSVFGGLTAACAASLAIRHAPPDRPLRSMHVQFVGPTVPGPVVATVGTLRSGSNVTFVEVRLSQADTLVLTSSLVFARHREESLTVAPAPPWRGPAPETLVDLPVIDGVIPEFQHNLRVRWAEGGFPFAGSDQANFKGYCRLKEPAGDVEGLLALLDAWPSPSLSLLTRPTAASTVSWTAHLVEIPPRHDGWYPFEYETITGAHGFHTMAGRLHDPSGRLLAWTEQLAVVFDAPLSGG